MDKLFKPLRSTKPAEDISRSQYSLVSSTDITAGALEVWNSLPDEVKFDPALEQFRQLYEKETGDTQKSRYNPVSRLPTINSAPHLHTNNLDKDEFIISGLKLTEDKQEKMPDAFSPKKKSKMAQARQSVKITLLVGLWVFFTVVFLMYNEKNEILRHSSLAPGETKSYITRNDQHKLSVLIKLSGPFISEQRQRRMNSSEIRNITKMNVWFEKRVLKPETEYIDDDDIYKTYSSEPWQIVIDNSTPDFGESETRSYIHTIESEHNSSVYAISMKTDSLNTIPFTLVYTLDPLDSTTGLVYGCMLLCALYGLIVFEIINRTMAAVLLSTASLAVLSLAGERPTLSEIVAWLDVETLLLLFSMMVLVALMQDTAVFDYLATLTFKLSKGKIWPLMSMLSLVTIVISLLLDNVTTVLLMTPISIRLCEVMELDPVPILILMVLFCNLGGAATPVGDPPNVIIASNKQVVMSGINFTNFTLHMSFGVILVAIQTYIQLRYMYRDISTFRLTEPRELLEIRRQISIWRRAADSLPQLSRDEIVIRDRIEKKIAKLSVRYESRLKESRTRACPKHSYEHMLLEMTNKYKIKDKFLLIKCGVTIVFVVVIFFLHSLPEFNRISLGWTALLGALLLLTLADREDLEPILHRIEWSTLLFFAALFVLMEALSKLGIIEYIGSWTEVLILRVDESDRLLVALVILLWVSGITSAFVDNVPLTTMMIRVVTSLGTNPKLNLPMAPLVWALAFGVCLGGNGTLIGASSNVVCAGIAEQHGYKINFMRFFWTGFPVMIGHLIVATAYLLICHCVFTWH